MESNYWQLRRELDSHPGYRAHRRWKSLQTAHGVYDMNRRILADYFELCQTDIGPVKELSTDPDSFWVGVCALLHNYVSSTGMLIDHTRNLMKAYSGEFSKAYAVRRDLVSSAPVARFTTRLRNCMVHADIPPLSFQLDMKRAEDGSEIVDHSIMVESERLLAQFNDWDKPSKHYIQENAPAFQLAKAVDEYSALTDSLYEWLFAQFTELHGDDIKAANDLIMKMNAAPTGKRSA